MNSNSKTLFLKLLMAGLPAFFVFVSVTFVRSNPDKPNTQVVLLRLLLPDSTVCMGAKAVHAEIELRNVSTGPVKLDPAGVGSGVHFQAFNDSGNPKGGAIFRSLDNTGDAWPKAKMQKIISLHGGESYRVAGEILLDPEFFAEPGIYRVSIDFSGRLKVPPDGGARGIYNGDITSNWVYFEVQDCDKK